MTNKPKRPIDSNQLAKFIVDVATGDAVLPESATSSKSESARKGGLKGGRARAIKLTPERRVEIAKIAARARWNKNKD